MLYVFYHILHTYISQQFKFINLKNIYFIPCVVGPVLGTRDIVANHSITPAFRGFTSGREETLMHKINFIKKETILDSDKYMKKGTEKGEMVMGGDIAIFLNVVRLDSVDKWSFKKRPEGAERQNLCVCVGTLVQRKH